MTTDATCADARHPSFAPWPWPSQGTQPRTCARLFDSPFVLVRPEKSLPVVNEASKSASFPTSSVQQRHDCDVTWKAASHIANDINLI